MSRTHLQIIALWDSIDAFAAAIGVTVVSARKMRVRKRISSAHFPAVLKTHRAKKHGVTFAELHAGIQKKAPAVAEKRVAA